MSVHITDLSHLICKQRNNVTVSEGNCTNTYTIAPCQTLLLSGDVELNPGPIPSSSQGGRSTRQTTLSISEGPGSLSDIVRELKDTSQQVNDKIDALGEKMEERCIILEKNLEVLRAEITKTKEERDEVKQKLDDLENRYRRNNIVFHGIRENMGETLEETEKILCNTLSKKHSMPVDDGYFERTHRVANQMSKVHPSVTM